MSGKSKASDWTDLGTRTAPIILLLVQSFSVKLKFTNLFLFSEQPFYENRLTLDSHTKTFSRQDGF